MTKSLDSDNLKANDRNSGGGGGDSASASASVHAKKEEDHYSLPINNNSKEEEETKKKKDKKKTWRKKKKPTSTTSTSTNPVANNSNGGSGGGSGSVVPVVECQFCQNKFTSRNALFRHLRTTTECFEKAQAVAAANAAKSDVIGGNSNNSNNKKKKFHAVTLPKQNVGIRFGYHVATVAAVVNNNNNDDDDNNKDVGNDENDSATKVSSSSSSKTTTILPPPNEEAAKLVQRAFLDALRVHQPIREEDEEEEGEGDDDDDNDDYGRNKNKKNKTKTTKTTTKMTQTSAARMRQICLAQDIDCSASSDFVGVNFHGENITTSSSILVQEMQQRLDHQQQQQQQQQAQQHSISNNNIKNNKQKMMIINKIQILDVQSLPLSTKFQAEQACTQRVYHYLLPLDWLLLQHNNDKEGRKDLHEWWKKQQHNKSQGQSQSGSFRSTRGGNRNQQPHQPRIIKDGEDRDIVNPNYHRRPEILKRLKRALQTLESKNLSIPSEKEKDGSKEDNGTATTNTGDADATATATTTAGGSSSNSKFHQHNSIGRNIASPGRFGSLWTKERRCWHNFADPNLGGKASPSYDPVWRGVDRAKVVEVISTSTTSTSSDNDNDNDDTAAATTTSNLIAVIEIRGDGFVQQQIRRMVGAVIAMVNDWLPLETYVTTATRSDICIETPLAPAGRQYFVGGRFHFMELLLANNDKTSGAAAMFEETTETSHRWEKELRNLLLLSSSSSSSNRQQQQEKEELAWLQELEHVVAPRIQTQLIKIEKDDKDREQRAAAMALDAVEEEEESKRTTKIEEFPNHTFTPPPSIYNETIKLLRSIVEKGKWPQTSKARSRVIRSVGGSSSTTTTTTTTTTSSSSASFFDGERFQSGSFTVVNPDLFQGNIPRANELFPDLTKAVFELESQLARESPGLAEGTHRRANNGGLRPPSTHCAVNSRAEFVPHVDSGRGLGQSVSMIVGLGDYTNGGSIIVEGKGYDIRYRPIEFDGWKQRHWTEPFAGERFSLVWFTPAMASNTTTNNSNNDSNSSGEDETTASKNGLPNIVRTEDVKAEQVVLEHQIRLPTFPKFKFRSGSTDALAINEILDAEKGCCYELKNHVWNEDGRGEGKDFSLSDHQCVLDIGAHIGAFSRYALAAGCKKIIAYEPEPNNLELLKDNVKPIDDNNSPQEVLVHAAAVADGESGRRELVIAKCRTDGTVNILNTWRHALENYSHYDDKTLARTSVLTIPFFGGALVPGVTFVKMDCEGAEMDILLSEKASSPASWMDVIDLVFEWSFTKEKRVLVFHKAIQNLKQAGFQVTYDGKGAWWDTSMDTNIMWPFHSDLVVFAKRC